MADEKMYVLLMQINTNLIQLLTLLRKMDGEGLKVRTQESHS